MTKKIIEIEVDEIDYEIICGELNPRAWPDKNEFFSWIIAEEANRIREQKRLFNQRNVFRNRLRKKAMTK